MGHLIRSPLKRGRDSFGSLTLASDRVGSGRPPVGAAAGEEVVGGVAMGVATGARVRSICTSASKILS